MATRIPEPYRTEALENMDVKDKNNKCNTQHEALKSAFFG
jgi:hypothetical protein